LGNCISGGQHARGKSPDIQEYLALPFGAESFLEAQTANTQIHKKLGDVLKKKSSPAPMATITNTNIPTLK